MNFLLSTDDNYAMPTGVLIYSVCENNPGSHNFFILSGKELRKEIREKIDRTVNRFSSMAFYIIVPNDYVSFLPMGGENQPKYITIATYYRLFLQSLLPETVERIVYLDGDIICRRSLSELWDTDLTDCPVAAVYEVENGDGRYSRLCYSETEGYFNAGVLLVNVRWWRENEAQTCFIEYIQRHADRIVYHDQDVLNAVFHGRIKPLPLKLNVLNSYFVKDDIGYKYNLEEVLCARKDPVLIHYSSHLKPWYKGCGHPYVDDFINYKKKSLWADMPQRPFPAKGIKGAVSSFLVSVGLKKYNGNYVEKL